MCIDGEISCKNFHVNALNVAKNSKKHIIGIPRLTKGPLPVDNVVNLFRLNVDIYNKYQICRRHCLFVVTPSSSSGWRYGMNGNSVSCRQPN